MATVLESKLRKLLRAWPEYQTGLISFVEPARGSDVGIADCMFTTARGLVPVELKRGPSVAKELRPAQRAWHRMQLHAGMPTYGLTALQDGSVKMFSLSLSGGLMSEMVETQLKRWYPAEDASFAGVCELFSRVSP